MNLYITTSVNTLMIRKQNSFLSDTEKALVVWIGQTSHNIPISQRSYRARPSLFNSMKAERGEEAAEEKFEAYRGWFMRFKETYQVYNIEMQGEAASVDIEIAASYLEDLVTIINKGGYTKEQILTVNKIAFMRRRCRQGYLDVKREEVEPDFTASKDKLFRVEQQSQDDNTPIYNTVYLIF